VGEVTRVDPTLLTSLVNSGYIPVVATVATDETGQALNVNADTAAGEVCGWVWRGCDCAGGGDCCVHQLSTPAQPHTTTTTPPLSLHLHCTQIAAALQAEKLILMTDVPGVLRDKDDVATK
jgi:acetylglutamate kinase